jgi:3-methyl-2-oxobutanoate hydroxymethyltransferase
MNGTRKKVRAPDLALMKERGERIVMLTAYDATMARRFDQAGIDLLLVGDSLGHVILGLETTVPVTMGAMLHHTRAVSRGTDRALVVADMPFLTYQVSAERAMRNAARFFQAGAAAVKVEGGCAMADTVRRLTAAGLPVMGHIRLTPQHVHRLGGMRRQTRDRDAADELMRDALALEDAGAFAIVLEAIPDAVAEEVTSRLTVPTIGIGAGPHCDGQVLVSYDMLGLFDRAPPFVKPYAALAESLLGAAKDFAGDVRRGVYAADAGKLPENLRVRDFTERTRRPLAEFVFGGQWGPRPTSRSRSSARLPPPPEVRFASLTGPPDSKRGTRRGQPYSPSVSENHPSCGLC